MWAFTRLTRVVRSLVHGRRLDVDLDAELRGYADLLTDEHIARGMDPARARRAALIELGGVEQVKEEVRSATYRPRSRRSMRSRSRPTSIARRRSSGSSPGCS